MIATHSPSMKLEILLTPEQLCALIVLINELYRRKIILRVFRNAGDDQEIEYELYEEIFKELFFNLGELLTHVVLNDGTDEWFENIQPDQLLTGRTEELLNDLEYKMHLILAVSPVCDKADLITTHHNFSIH